MKCSVRICVVDCICLEGRRVGVSVGEVESVQEGPPYRVAAADELQVGEAGLVILF